MEGELAPGELAHYEDVRRRFYAFLWNFAEYAGNASQTDPSAAISGDSMVRDGLVTYPYRCA